MSSEKDNEQVVTALGQNLSEEVVDPAADDKKAAEDKDYLAEYVGDGKKYASVEEAAKALAKKAVHADAHIEQILSEKKELEKKALAVEEVLAYIKQTSAKSQDDSSVSKEVISAEVNTGSLSKEEIVNVVEDYFKKREAVTSQKEMHKVSWNKLKDAAGSEVAAKLALTEYVGKDKNKAKLVDTLAITDPDGLVTLVLKNKEMKNITKSSDESVSLSKDGEVEKLTWEYIRKVKKENPKLYNSMKFQKMIHNSNFII